MQFLKAEVLLGGSFPPLVLLTTYRQTTKEAAWEPGLGVRLRGRPRRLAEPRLHSRPARAPWGHPLKSALPQSERK